jgi:hypothetical protein
MFCSREAVGEYLQLGRVHSKDDSVKWGQLSASISTH